MDSRWTRGRKQLLQNAWETRRLQDMHVNRILDAKPSINVQSPYVRLSHVRKKRKREQLLEGSAPPHTRRSLHRDRTVEPTAAGEAKQHHAQNSRPRPRPDHFQSPASSCKSEWPEAETGAAQDHPRQPCITNMARTIDNPEATAEQEAQLRLPPDGGRERGTPADPPESLRISVQSKRGSEPAGKDGKVRIAAGGAQSDPVPR